ncbi:MAG: hypothetical protein KGD57_03620 [Candidatus Lokiarchaeota archaeon]|nr:hypothetical protein [Candidatus Lokiarchaeota archaeon]
MSRSVMILLNYELPYIIDYYQKEYDKVNEDSSNQDIKRRRIFKYKIKMKTSELNRHKKAAEKAMEVNREEKKSQ